MTQSTQKTAQDVKDLDNMQKQMNQNIRSKERHANF
jgi:hypothetical protein